MLRLFLQISLRYFRESWGRTMLILGGVATGVALVVAIDIINASVLGNFRNTLLLIAGPADLQVTLGIGEIGFDESTLAIVRTDRNVHAAVALVRGVVVPVDIPAEPLQLFGVDLTLEEELKRYPITTEHRQEILRSFGDLRSILVTRAFASRHGLGVDDTLRLSTPTGLETFTIRGLLDAEGAATVFGGQLAVMDLPAAQLTLGKLHQIDQIDVVLVPSVDPDAAAAEIVKQLPKTLTIATPATRGKHYERILASFQMMLTGLGLLCLVAGLYIVYNTSSTAAARRAFAMAELQLVGADARRLFRLWMLEAGLLGAAGTLLGIPVGIGLAWLLTGMVSESMGIIFQLRFPLDALSIERSKLVVAALLGMTVAVAASFFAARRVARLDPLDTLRADLRQYERPSMKRFVLVWSILVGASVIALVLEVRQQSAAWGNLGSTLWFASSIVIAVPLVSVSGALISRLLTRLAPASGRTASESLFRSPVRTGVTVAAITLVLTLAVTISCLLQSLRGSVGKYYQPGGYLSGDLVVSAVSTQGGWLETPLPEAVRDELLSIAGVSSVEVARALPGQLYEDERVMLLGLSDGLLAPSHYGSEWYRGGTPAEASAAIRQGTGANVSASFAERFRVNLGDRIRLEAPNGRLELSVAGVVYDYMSDRGTITINRDLLVSHWNDTAVNRFSLFLNPESVPRAVRASVVRSLGARYKLKVLSSKEMVDYHVAFVDQAFAFTNAIQLLVAVVTVAGIFDLLVSAIVERRRELALWRLIGADDPIVRRSVVIESATVGLLGVVLGTAVGLVTAWIWIGINFRYLVGFYLDFVFAFPAYIGQVALIVGMTVLAGYSAARFATRESVLEGIQIE